MSSENQATIPKQVREYLGLKPGDRIKFFFQPDGLVATLRQIPVSTLKGSLPKQKKPVTVEEMNAAFGQGANR